MKKTTIHILINVIILSGLLLATYIPFEITNKTIFDIICWIFFIVFFTLVILNIKLTRKLRRSYKYGFQIITGIISIPYIYLFLWFIIMGFQFPNWEDQIVYKNLKGRVIIEQEHYISGSIIDWRKREKIKEWGFVRLSKEFDFNALNGIWIKTDLLKNQTDTIMFKDGIEIHEP